MPKTATQRIFAAAGKAARKAYEMNVQKLTETDIAALIEARDTLRGFLHTMTGSRPGHIRDMVREAVEHVHFGKDYSDIDLVVRDVADAALTLTRLAQRRNRSRPETLQECVMLCDQFRHD